MATVTDPFPPRIFDDRRCVDGAHIFQLSSFGTTCECGKAAYRLALTTGGVDVVVREPHPFELVPEREGTIRLVERFPAGEGSEDA